MRGVSSCKCNFDFSLNCWDDTIVGDILNLTIKNEQSQQIQERKKQSLVKFIVFFSFSFPNCSRIKNIFGQCNSTDHLIKGTAMLMVIMTVL